MTSLMYYPKITPLQRSPYVLFRILISLIFSQSKRRTYSLLTNQGRRGTLHPARYVESKSGWLGNATIEYNYNINIA